MARREFIGARLGPAEAAALDRVWRHLQDNSLVPVSRSDALRYALVASPSALGLSEAEAGPVRPERPVAPGQPFGTPQP